MASLTTNSDFRLRRRKATRAGIVILLETGRVALCAATVPILVRASPMQPVVWGKVLPRVEVVPTLFLDIPNYVEAL